MMVGKMKVKRPRINEGGRSYTILSLTALDLKALRAQLEVGVANETTI